MDEKIKLLYQGLYDKFGISPESVKARDKHQQEKRFSNLISLTEIKESDSVLDIGCGSAELLKYLRGMGFKGQYYGIDFISDFINHAKKEFNSDSKAFFDEKNILVDDFENKFDWVVLSGVFNDKRENSEEYFYKTINKMFEVCKKGIVFNSLSKYVDYEDESLYYTYPDLTLKYCIEKLSKYTIINTNYQLKKDTIPFEYSICVFNK